MKSIFIASPAILILLPAGLAVSLNTSGQCTNVHSNYTDLVEWINSGKPVDAQFTLINPALQDGSHYYTAFGASSLTISSISFRGAPGKSCRLVSAKSIPVSFSDRTAQCNGNTQTFSSGAPDNSQFIIDLAGNTITMVSLTWNFQASYSNCVRRGNIIYAFSGNSMLVVNLFKNYPIL